eukprot:COSAG04_NODE_5655_length_1538_cov_1.585823_1_plen_92_part_00
MTGGRCAQNPAPAAPTALSLATRRACEAALVRLKRDEAVDVKVLGPAGAATSAAGAQRFVRLDNTGVGGCVFSHYAPLDGADPPRTVTRRF